MKRCRIRHTYGEEEEGEGISEEEALQIAQDAVSEGAADGCRTMPETSVQDFAAAPENSVVTLGGRTVNGVVVLPTVGKATRTAPITQKMPQVLVENYSSSFVLIC